MNLKEIKKDLEVLSKRVDKAIEENEKLHKVEQPESQDLDWATLGVEEYAFEVIHGLSYMFHLKPVPFQSKPNIQILRITRKNDGIWSTVYEDIFWAGNTRENALEIAEDTYNDIVAGTLK